jgi:hypothetical protein
MMKGMLKGLTAFAFVSMVATSAAQAQTPVQFGLGGGLTLKSGNGASSLKNGWNGQALVRFQPAGLPVGIQIDGNYHQLKFDPAKTTVKGKNQIVDGTANVVYTFQTAAESQFHPYLIAGGGVYNVKSKFDATTTTPASSASVTKFGVNAGAGFDFNVGAAALYVEGRFHNIFISGSHISMIPINVGIKFGGK